MNKKTISSIMAIVLLLVVALTSIAMFKNWFGSYNSNILSDIEQKNSGILKSELKISGLVGDHLYLQSKKNLSLSTLLIEEKECLTSIDLKEGLNKINISNCLVGYEEYKVQITAISYEAGQISDNFYYDTDSYDSFEEIFQNCSLDSITIEHTSSHTFYNSNSVPFGHTCDGISRTCDNGTLSGDNSYQYSSCSPLPLSAYQNCSLDSITMQHTSSRTFYNSNNVPFGHTCDGISRTCDNGTLSGDNSYQYSSCSPLPLSAYQNCSLDSITMQHTSSHTFYNSNSVPFGHTCDGISRTCDNGTLSGDNSYQYSSCSILPLPASLICNTDNDGDNYINSICAKYPVVNLTYEGKMDINDNLKEDEQGITVDYNCWLKDDKSGCENNLIIGGCENDNNGINDTILDLGTGLCWQRDLTLSGKMNWATAINYCNNLELANNSDWYLPSFDELRTIMDYSKIYPAIIGGNSIFIAPSSSYHWSSTTWATTTTQAHVFYTYLGASDVTIKTSTTPYALCVRRMI